MGQKEIAKLVMVAGAAGLISILIAGAIFKSGHQPTTVPVVQSISADFPDVNNDPNYKTIFNTKALDPTQLINISSSQNKAPFNGAQ